MGSVISMRIAFLSFCVFPLAGCVAPIPPVEVTRFHVPEQIEAGGFVIDAAPGVNANTLEFGTYSAAVTRELLRLGFKAEGAPRYHVVVGYERTERSVAKRSPVTIGLGGGSFGSHVGLGIGTSFGVGGGTKGLVLTRMSVQMKRASDSAVLWEGRAHTESAASAPAAQPGLAASKLATALFQDFPGDSGRTITVP